MRDDYLRTAFDMFDKDGSGKIDKNEIMGLAHGPMGPARAHDFIIIFYILIRSYIFPYLFDFY